MTAPSDQRLKQAPRRYASSQQAKADEYRYWQSRSGEERMDAVEQLTRAAYALKGLDIEENVPRLQRPLVRLPLPWR